MRWKRGLGLVLAAGLLMGMPVSAARIGDVNGDGGIDSSDARIVLQASVGKLALSTAKTEAADTDGSGSIDSSDARLILQYSVGKLSVFPAPPIANTVRVTIPEGYSVPRIAALLEDRGVCTADAFYQAVQTADISDYAFAADLPDAAGRAFRLEGYLFPDTYEFYRDCSGESALRRFLDNFDYRTAALREQLGNRSLDELVIFASIVQREVGNVADMKRVARVLQNRLEHPAEFPSLQCDASYAYLRELAAAGITCDEGAYDTYVCRGLPVGAIANPGLAALNAAWQPSDEAEIANCYFFAFDFKTGITYYSETYAEHEAVCREHGIGMYG
jgi:UPF0755 protein